MIVVLLQADFTT